MKRRNFRWFFGGVFSLLIVFVSGQERKNDQDFDYQPYRAALRLVGQDKYDEAFEAMKEVLAKNPTFFRPGQKMVEIAVYQNQLDAARDYFEAFLRDNPDHPGALYGLGVYYDRKKDPGRANEFYKKALGLCSSSPMAYTAFVNTSLKLKQAAEAESTLTAILKKEPANGAANFGLGFLWFKKNQWDEALKQLDKAIELSPGLLLAYEVKSDVYEAQSKFKEVLALSLEKAKACENKDPDLQIDFYTRISSAYNTFGRYKEALEIDETALQLAREIGNKKSEAIIEGNVGVFYAQVGDFPKALEYFNRKLAVVTKMNEKEEQVVTMVNIGGIFSWKGDNRQSLEWYKKALPLAEELGNLPRKAWILGNIGVAYEGLSEYPEALGFHRQALSIFQGLKNPENEAWILGNIGVLMSKLGDNEAALENLSRALAILQEIGDKKNESWILGTIGALYTKAEDRPKSLEYLNKALQIAREIGDKQNEVSHLGNLGEKYRENGELDKAADCLDQALKIAEEIQDIQASADTWIVLGILDRDRQNYDRSLEDFGKAVKIGNDIGSLHHVWNAEWGLALTYEKKESLLEALEHYRNSITALENLRARLQTEEQKVGFQKGTIQIYEGYITLLLRLREKKPEAAQAYLDESFHTAERAKARAFLELLAEAKVTPAREVSPDVESEEKTFQGELTAIQQKLLDTEIKDADREKLYQELQKFEARYRDFIADLRIKNPRYASLVYPEPYDVARVQKQLLDKRTFLLEFFVGEDNFFIWVVSRDSPLRCYSFPSRADFLEKISSYQSQILQHRIRIDLHLGKELYDQLLKAALQDIPALSRLLIIPDGLLLRFPFEALIKEIKDGTPRYLVEDYILSYGPSASVLGELRAVPRKKTSRVVDFFGLGNPVIDEKKTSGTALEYVRSRGTALLDLPFAEKEVEKIGGLYEEKKRKAEVYVGEKALEERLKSQNAADFTVVHLATHGLIDDRVPALSGLLLAPSQGPEGDDGFLRLNEIFNLSLNADLVTLSACETALGKEVRGEGMIGLIRAFIYAGARSILASLWMVNDLSTSKLMEDFYSQLLRGQKAPEALRQAKLEFLKGGDMTYRHPFFWAPFILVGQVN